MIVIPKKKNPLKVGSQFKTIIKILLITPDYQFWLSALVISEEA